LPAAGIAGIPDILVLKPDFYAGMFMDFAPFAYRNVQFHIVANFIQRFADHNFPPNDFGPAA
jgi:hypothetical protein